MNSKRSILEGAVPGLDAVMGGSLPDGDMRFIVGAPLPSSLWAQSSLLEWWWWEWPSRKRWMRMNGEGVVLRRKSPHPRG